MKGKRIKQVNNLTIYYTKEHGYSVWTPDGRCWEDRFDSIEQAEEYCMCNIDFTKKGAINELFNYFSN